MSLTARHKKPGGFKKLVRSLETTARDKRERIIELMRAEDADFTAEVEASIFRFDEIKDMEDSFLAEITSRMTDMRVLAFALHKYDEGLTAKIKRCLSPAQLFQLKEATEAIGSEKISRTQQISAQFKVIENARKIEEGSHFVLKKYSNKYPG